MDEQKILELASRLVLAASSGNEDEVRAVSEELAAVLRQPEDENGSADGAAPPLIKDKMGFLKFTEKEILKMPKNFRKTFRASGCTVHVRKRLRSKRGYTYEARYRCDGYNISVSSKHYDKLKELFIEALRNADEGKDVNRTPTSFDKFSLFFFETFKKRKVTNQTYISDLRRLKNHLIPVFGNTPIKSITPAQCSKDEEKALLRHTAGTKYQLLFALVLYTGMRPNEYPTAKIEGKFIVAVNSKRKGRKIEYKKIPITPMLAPYLEGVTEFKFPGKPYLSAKLKEVLPNHKLYDLRTTFYTRCQECGVADVARMEFVGHSLGALGDAYTDLSDEFLLSEGKKLDY